MLLAKTFQKAHTQEYKLSYLCFNLIKRPKRLCHRMRSLCQDYLLKKTTGQNMLGSGGKRS